MRHKVNQKGFSVIIAVITIAVIAALALGGWYVWDKNKKNDNTNKPDKTSQNDQNNEDPSDPSEDGKYLVIEEWGVRFELPNSLKRDIYYRLDRNDILKAEFASFASNKLDELAGDGRCTFKNNPQNNGLTARLLRGYPDELNDNPDEIKSAREPIANFNGIAYHSPVINPNSVTCATAYGGNDPIPGLYDTEQEISSQLREAFKTLETIE